MKKKVLSLVLSLLLCLGLGLSASAQSNDFILDFEDVVYDEEPLELLAQEIYDLYGIAVVYARTSSLEGMTGAEYAQQLYASYVPFPDAVVLIDCAEASSYFMYYAGKAESVFNQSSGSALITAFDEAGTFDEGVRDYFISARSILSQKGNIQRELVLLEDESEATEIDAPLLSLTDSQTHTQQSQNSSQIPEERQLPLIVDTAGVIDPAYVQQLNLKAENISEKYKCEVAAVFVNTTGNVHPQAFADDFYDYNGYGYGSGDDGILLLVAVGDRSFAVSTYGSAGYTFTDYGQSYMDEKYVPCLRNNDWGGAAEAYLNSCAELLEYEAKNGAAYDYIAEEYRVDYPALLLMSLFGGFVLAFIPISGMKKKMLNVQKKSDAADYMRQGSFNLHHRYDRYITSQVTRTPIPKENSSNNRGGGFGGGGSSFHTSSSGRTHGGHSGRF